MANNTPAIDLWMPSGIANYDRSIHSNPDAKAWADFFVEVFPGLKDKHDLMVGWFANAMMAMHDHIHSQPNPLSEQLASVTAERDVLKAEIKYVRECKKAIKELHNEAAYRARKAHSDLLDQSNALSVKNDRLGAERDALRAELEALRNQEPVGEWRVHSKNRAGEEFGRFISEQIFEDGQKFYISPVKGDL